ncbi:MAG: ABC transporter ATP-binding protein [candidate division Zixibacteria bacterium]|nr:ABC transporter ATP-binding protein [candidate division Zixibacteria bacterium]
MTTPLIQIQSVHKAFNGQPVLDGVSLDIARGESITVIGQSGCGKSVLLKHVIRLLEPDQGRVLFNGKDLGELDLHELTEVRRRIGMLFQSAALFDSMTVAENVGLGLKESRQYGRNEIDRIVAEKLKMVGLAKAADKNPAELSGGMRKRVGLARAIAGNPEVLLYDEPTTGLDPITSDVINDLIVRLTEMLDVTSISVTHDMKSAFKISNRFVMLYEGRIRFDGSPEELRQSDDSVIQQFITGNADGPIKVR